MVCMAKCSNLTGKVFGDLTVLERLPNNIYGKSRWLFRCSCGFEFEGGTRTTSNSYLTCRKCAAKKAGFDSRKYEKLGDYKYTYTSWKAMRERCRYSKGDYYEHYGGRGISVCDEWDCPYAGFERFIQDMGNRPIGETLDRIDVNGDYCKVNCRWVDLTTQAYNTNRGHLNKSGKIGVRLVRRKSGIKYVATIGYNNETHYLGIFNSFEEACKAREEAEIKYYGVTK